jgi:hypothetical protein
MMHRIRVVWLVLAAVSAGCASHKPARETAPVQRRDTTRATAMQHPTTRLPDLTAWVDSAILARRSADSSGTRRTP